MPSASKDSQSRVQQRPHQAVAQRDTEAQSRLGVMYYGGESVPQDHAEAAEPANCSHS